MLTATLTHVLREAAAARSAATSAVSSVCSAASLLIMAHRGSPFRRRIYPHVSRPERGHVGSICEAINDCLPSPRRIPRLEVQPRDPRLPPIYLFAKIAFRLFRSRSSGAARKLHERLLELLIVIAFVGGDLSEHLRHLLVARLLRFIGETDIHLRILVVFAGHRVRQVPSVETRQARRVGLSRKMFLGLDVCRFFKQPGKLLIPRLPGGFSVTAILQIGVRLAVHGGVEIFAGLWCELAGSGNPGC